MKPARSAGRYAASVSAMRSAAQPSALFADLRPRRNVSEPDERGPAVPRGRSAPPESSRSCERRARPDFFDTRGVYRVRPYNRLRGGIRDGRSAQDMGANGSHRRASRGGDALRLRPGRRVRLRGARRQQLRLREPARHGGGLAAAAPPFVYAQVAGFGFVGLDDNSYVSENPHVMAGLSGPSVAWAWTTTTETPWGPPTLMSFLLGS